jgi:hypothetical protein
MLVKRCKCYSGMRGRGRSFGKGKIINRVKGWSWLRRNEAQGGKGSWALKDIQNYVRALKNIEFYARLITDAACK